MSASTYAQTRASELQAKIDRGGTTLKSVKQNGATLTKTFTSGKTIAETYNDNGIKEKAVVKSGKGANYEENVTYFNPVTGKKSSAVIKKGKAPNQTTIKAKYNEDGKLIEKHAKEKEW